MSRQAKKANLREFVKDGPKRTPNGTAVQSARKIERKKFSLVLPEETHRRFKVNAAHEGREMSALLDEALNEYCGKLEKKRGRGLHR